MLGFVDEFQKVIGDSFQDAIANYNKSKYWSLEKIEAKNG
jgi:hypothetical protein